jgi:hypothetical protein
MKGYKVFDPDWTCRGFRYEVGKTYEHKGELELCRSGFHFCKKAIDCFRYYKFNPNNKVAEVVALGRIIEVDGDTKCVTDKIKIERELSWHEVLDLVNTGHANTGFGNSGDYNGGSYNSGYSNSGDYNSGYDNSGNYNSGYNNSGDYNSGHSNSGNYNSGHSNSGNYNSGYSNSGHGNSGNYNSSDWNSGNYNSGYSNSGYNNSGNYNSGYNNSGDWNSGDWNVTDGNSGCFCTETHTIKFFDRDSDWTLKDWRMSKAYLLLRGAPLSPVKWIPEADMTDEEKVKHPEHTTTGGYLKKLSLEERVEAAQEWWDSLEPSKKAIIKELPNFDPIKFKQITGIEVD